MQLLLLQAIIIQVTAIWFDVDDPFLNSKALSEERDAILFCKVHMSKCFYWKHLYIMGRMDYITLLVVRNLVYVINYWMGPLLILFDLFIDVYVASCIVLIDFTFIFSLVSFLFTLINWSYCKSSYHFHLELTLLYV